MLQAYKILAASYYYVGSEKVKLTSTEKLILIMLDCLFSKQVDSDTPIKLTQRYIADSIACDLKATGKALKNLTSTGIIKAERPAEKFNSYEYYSIGGFTLHMVDGREIEFVQKVKSIPNAFSRDVVYSNPYYVYICYLKGRPVYVGKGKDNRIAHCTSGKSSSQALNAALFEHGKQNMSVEKVLYNLSESNAVLKEREVICQLKSEGFTLYNIT